MKIYQLGFLLYAKGFLKDFLPCFAVDTLGCDGSCLEPCDGNILAAGFAQAKGAVFDSFYSFLNLFDQFVFPVPDSQLKVAVGLMGGPVCRICKILFWDGHAGYRVVGMGE